MQPERHVRLFRNGRSQALRTPRELELDADEAIVRKYGDRLIVEPVRRRPDLATLLAGWEPLDEVFPTWTKVCRHWTTSDFSDRDERRGPSLPARHQCPLRFDPPTSGTGGRDVCQARLRYRLQHRRGGRASLRCSQARLQGIDGQGRRSVGLATRPVPRRRGRSHLRRDPASARASRHTHWPQRSADRRSSVAVQPHLGH